MNIFWSPGIHVYFLFHIILSNHAKKSILNWPADLTIVRRGDWLWMEANIKDKNNGLVVYVGSSCDVFIGQYDQDNRNAI